MSLVIWQQQQWSVVAFYPTSRNIARSSARKTPMASPSWSASLYSSPTRFESFSGELISSIRVDVIVDFHFHSDFCGLLWNYVAFVHNLDFICAFTPRRNTTQQRAFVLNHQLMHLHVSLIKVAPFIGSLVSHKLWPLHAVLSPYQPVALGFAWHSVAATSDELNHSMKIKPL